MPLHSAVDLKHYLSIRGVTNPSLRADGGRLVFLYNVTGSMQIHTLDRPQGWPPQRTFYPNRVATLEYAPTGNRLVFGMDDGGNEREGLCLSDDDGQNVIALTDRPEVKYMFGCWNEAGTQIAFTATHDNRQDFNVYTMDIATRAIEKVSSLTGYNYVRAWYGDSLIVSHATGNDNNDLHSVNLTTRQERLLTPHERKAVFQGGAPSSDQKFLIVTTNFERDFFNLARINLETLGVEFLSERTWDEESLEVTRDGRFAVVCINEAGLSVLEIHDLEEWRAYVWGRTADSSGHLRQPDERRELVRVDHGGRGHEMDRRDPGAGPRTFIDRTRTRALAELRWLGDQRLVLQTQRGQRQTPGRRQHSRRTRIPGPSQLRRDRAVVPDSRPGGAVPERAR